MFDTTRLTWPADTVVGAALSIMGAPKGAVPDIIWVMPMSPSITFTMAPGIAVGTEQDNRAKVYAGSAFIIPAPPPFIGEPVGVDAVAQPASNAPTATSSAHRRHTMNPVHQSMP